MNKENMAADRCTIQPLIAGRGCFGSLSGQVQPFSLSVER
jgi:hypothetical protein